MLPLQIHWPVSGNVGSEVVPSIQETWTAMEQLVKDVCCSPCLSVSVCLAWPPAAYPLPPTCWSLAPLPTPSTDNWPLAPGPAPIWPAPAPLP